MAAAFFLGPGRSADVFDFTTGLGSKIYFKASAALDEKFDGKPDTFNNFMAKVANRARTFGWETILTVNNDAGTPRNLLTAYGMITLANVRAHATANYIGQQTRDAQNTEMLYHFVYNSLGPDFQTKVHLHEQDYTVGNALDGVSLLKRIIMLTFIDTRATTAHIRELLVDMTCQLAKVEYNIAAFNQWIDKQRATLRSRGEDATDLSTYLWKAYTSVPDKEFVRYIKSHRDRYLDGSANYTSEEIMSLDDNNYKTRYQTDDWRKPPDEEEEIVALNAKISSLENRSTVTIEPNPTTTKKQATGNKPVIKTATKTATANTATVVDANWHKTKPKPIDTKQDGFFTKNVKEKQFFWCPNHNEGAGQWVRHHPNEC